MSKDTSLTDRRDLLKGGVLGTMGAGLAIASTTSVAIAGTEVASKDPEVTNQVDVLVVVSEIHARLREHGQIVPSKA